MPDPTEWRGLVERVDELIGVCQRVLAAVGDDETLVRRAERELAALHTLRLSLHLDRALAAAQAKLEEEEEA